MATSVRTTISRGRIRKSLVRRVIEAVTGSQAQTRRLPPSPFLNWNYDRIEDAIDEAFEDQTIDISVRERGPSVTPAAGQAFFYPRKTYTNPIVINRLFFQGDHWQNGDGWIGPHPEISNSNFTETMQEIANIFTSKNAVREATMRHSLGVVGRTMQWGFSPLDDQVDATGKPPDEVIAKIEEAKKLIRPWLQSRKVQTLLRDAVCTLLLSERAGVQLVIPPGLADSDGQGNLVIEANSIADALNYIFPEHPLPDNAAVVQDKDTRMEAGVWRYTKDDEDDAANIAEGGDTVVRQDEEEIDYVAICFVDETGDTVIRVYRDGETDVYAESNLKMGGRIPMFEMRRAALITIQVQQGQRALNLAESMIPRTAVTAGFLERLIIDAQLPGEPERDEEGNETGRWIEKPFYTGAGTTNFVQSTEYEDEEGRIKRASAKTVFREPIAATGPITASDKHYRSILDETGQLHVVMAGDSNPSGTSRLNARIEYLSTLQLTQGEVEACFRFIIDTALAMAEALSKKEGYFTNFIRCQAACRLDAGPLQPAERAAIEASIGKTISQETAMMLVGIEDVEAEKARMALDPLSRATYGSTVGDALNKLTAPGAPLEGAARFIGIDQKLIDLLMSGSPGPEQLPSSGAPTGTGPISAKKPEPAPSAATRGPGQPGPEKVPLPSAATKPAMSGSGSSSGAGLPISGAK